MHHEECKNNLTNRAFLTVCKCVKKKKKVSSMVSNLWVDDQEGDHPMFFQVGVPALSVSGFHLVRALQVLQRHRGNVDPPAKTTQEVKSSTVSTVL